MQDRAPIPPVEPYAATLTDAMPVAQPTAMTPVSVHERIMTLDVLRGFALLGIFMVNMQFFAMPYMAAIFDPTLVDEPASEVWSWAIVQWFFEFKFISLFSLLFGIGFTVQLMRAQSRGSRFMPVYLRRLAVLSIIGLCHALLLWYGDILFIYSVVALGLLLTKSFKPRSLLIAAACSWLLGTILMTGMAGLQVMGEQMKPTETAAASASSSAEIENVDASSQESPGDENLANSVAAEAETQAQRRRLVDLEPHEYDPYGDAWLQAETDAYKHGPFLDAFLVRAVSWAMMLIFGIFTFAWHILAMFLLGAALMKMNFFTRAFSHWHRLLAFAVLPVGIAIEGLIVYTEWVTAFEVEWHLLGTTALHELGSVMMCMGFVGAWTLIVHSGTARWLINALARTGRMALTNYLSQTVIATFLMYWWGLGWFGEVSRMQQIGLVLLIYVLQVLFSTIWMGVFSIGPMEWVWRSLTYLRPQPVRQVDAADHQPVAG